MADIEKQLIAKCPVKRNLKITLDYKNGWNVKTKKIWGNKEVDRVNFNLTNNNGIFECSPIIAEKIIQEVSIAFLNSQIENEDVKTIDIEIIPYSNLHLILIDTKSLPRKSLLKRLWNKLW